MKSFTRTKRIIKKNIIHLTLITINFDNLDTNGLITLFIYQIIFFSFSLHYKILFCFHSKTVAILIIFIIHSIYPNININNKHYVIINKENCLNVNFTSILFKFLYMHMCSKECIYYLQFIKI